MPEVITRFSEKFGRQYTDDLQNGHAVRVFRVTMNQDVYFIANILDDPQVPALGSAYSIFRPELRCVGREVSEIGRNLKEYEITVTYDRFPYNDWDVKFTSQTVETVLEKTLEAGSGDLSENDHRPSRFKLAPSFYLPTKPDGYKGENVLNRARDPFDPPPTYPRQQVVITADIMVSNITDLGFRHVGDLEAMVGKVNSSKIQLFSFPDESGEGCDYWTLLLEEAQVTKIKTPTGCAYQISLRIIYDPLGHCAVVLNAGYNEIVLGGTVAEKKRKCRGADQAESSIPLPLKDDGSQISLSDLPNNINYIICPTHEATAFSALRLPTTFCGTVTIPVVP
jgi:hypothetical protein